MRYKIHYFGFRNLSLQIALKSTFKAPKSFSQAQKHFQRPQNRFQALKRKIFPRGSFLNAHIIKFKPQDIIRGFISIKSLKFSLTLA